MERRHETTANALSFTVYLLSLNKDKEAKMMEEIARFGRDKKPRYEDLEQFPYVEAVLKARNPFENSHTGCVRVGMYSAVLILPLRSRYSPFDAAVM